jgi:hypothetical protein
MQGQGLRARIEESYSRIERFKLRNRDQLVTRASEKWMKDNEALLERLFFEIYPAINDPKKPCQLHHIKDAEKTLRQICQ